MSVIVRTIEHGVPQDLVVLQEGWDAPKTFEDVLDLGDLVRAAHFYLLPADVGLFTARFIVHCRRVLSS